MTKRANKSAGIADPYWYEWGIGLLKVVEMLNPDSGIAAVAFQKDGVKGWDDVVVRFSSETFEYYQVKHSRIGINLTFSTLVGSEEGDKPSLLKSLTSSWKEMELGKQVSKFILITNRSSGRQAGRSRDGVYYPALSDFIDFISDHVKSVSSLAEVSIQQEEWEDAWQIWLAEMAGLSNDEKLQFMQQLEISDAAGQLEDIRPRLEESLASLFQINKQRTGPLVDKLISALPEWTTSKRPKEWIDAENVMEKISDYDPAVFGFCNVPTPVPFLPSREQSIKEICSLLTSNGSHRVVFLEAEPGSGKTSVISRIMNQRFKNDSALVVDLRYYTYTPITPDSPSISADADGSASAQSLWYTLLNQMRKRLRGRLLKLDVPVKNDFTTPDEARDHVLRLSGVLGEEKGAPFVIVIDGIDHAARASRKGLPSLLGSLPSPETVPDTVRLLIAGQPADAYPEYPIWLRSENCLVMKSCLGPLEMSDIQLLLSHSATSFLMTEQVHAARIILGVAEGNTLAAVFAVAEAETCTTLEDLEARLTERKLHSGVHAYYTEIWQAAISKTPRGLSPYLSSVLCLLRERVTGEMLQKAFPCWAQAAPQWSAFLKALEPLVILDKDGYRVRHNDIRVFLEKELKADADALQRVTSLLSEYYMGKTAHPLFKQLSLFTLLRVSGRAQDMARVFTPHWVLEANAYGRDLSTIYEEAEEAFRAIPEVKDWEVALSVACAGMTLWKMAECLESVPELLESIGVAQPSLPQCLESERFVLPFNQWDEERIRNVLQDIRLLSEGGERDRARGLLQHWFKDLSPAEVFAQLTDMNDVCDFHRGCNIDMGDDSLFMHWASLSYKLDLPTKLVVSTEVVDDPATCLFEKGWITECVKESEPEIICATICKFNPQFPEAFEVATEEAAKRSLWVVVGALLNLVKEKNTQSSSEFLIKAAYWALKSEVQECVSEWLEILPDARIGKLTEYHNEVPLMLFVAKTIGWLEPHRDSATISQELVDVIVAQGRHGMNRNSIFLSLRAAAMIGLAERMLSKADIDGAAVLISAPTIHDVIIQIWEHQDPYEQYEYVVLARDLSFRLIEICESIGGMHGEMVISLALSTTEKLDVDNQKIPVLWKVLRSAGRFNELRAWAVHWIGEEGEVWSGFDYSERSNIVTEFCRVCRDEEWFEIANNAEFRLRYHYIGYSGYKEYAFQEPLDWIRELFIADPSAWQQEGLQLLDICRECQKQGGDNRLSTEIENEIAAAAFRCSPSDSHAFFTEIGPKEEYDWLHKVRTSLINASTRVIAEHVVKDLDDILALWCCAVGLTRWHDRYQAQTVTVLRDAILSAVDSDIQQQLENRLKFITPGEFLREEYDKERNRTHSIEECQNTDTTYGEIGDFVSELVKKVDNGYEPNLKEIGGLALRIVRDNPVNRRDLLQSLFKLIDANRVYVTRWDVRSESHPIKQLLPLLRESEIWELIRAAALPIGNSFCPHSVSHNVHLICLYQAVGKGTDYLKAGTQKVFAMHRLWAGLPDPILNGEIKPTHRSNYESWPEFSVAVLKHLLLSDSADTVTAALRGLCALVEVSPKAVAGALNGSNGIIRSRLLIGAEVWAARKPSEFTPVLESIGKLTDDVCFADTIQLWICNLAATQTQGGFTLTRTFMPHEALAPRAVANLIVTMPRRLLAINPRRNGGFQLANNYSAAKNWIDRLHSITGCDIDDIENTIAKSLEKQNQIIDEIPTNHKKQHFAIEDILYDALQNELRKPKWCEEHAGDVAIAMTHGDDPWIIRKSPLPSPSNFDWPHRKEIDEWLNTQQDKTNVLNRLKLLASGEDLPSNQLVLGSCLRVFTSNYDIEMWYWLELSPGDGFTVRSKLTCPSSRSFQYFLPERFEPHSPNRTPLVLFSGSISRLSFSRMEVILTLELQANLGWRPKPDNPLEWTSEESTVARYETYHGPLVDNHGGRHMRQSTLARWVADLHAVEELGPLLTTWDYEVHNIPDK